ATTRRLSGLTATRSLATSATSDLLSCRGEYLPFSPPSLGGPVEGPMPCTPTSTESGRSFWRSSSSRPQGGRQLWTRPAATTRSCAGRSPCCSGPTPRGKGFSTATRLEEHSREHLNP